MMRPSNVMFLKPNNPSLKEISGELSLKEINSAKTQQIIHTMLETIEIERKKKKKGVGLAAVQIGILKRIILVDTKADPKNLPAGRQGKNKPNFEIFINPEIIWKSRRKKEWYEGCFSTDQICGIVKRPISIKIQGFKASQPQGFKAKWVNERYTGYVARIFQHEIDHLNGTVFIAHITNPDKLHKVGKNEFSQYRKLWRNWPKKYPLPLA